MDIYEALLKDHEEMRELLIELSTISEEDDYKDILLDKISKLMTSHARAEESVLYNSMRAISDSEEVMHGYKEHMETEAILRKMQLKEVIGADWQSAADELKKAMFHHLKEEEAEIFNEAKKMFSDEEAKQMGDAFLKMQSDIEDQGFLKNSFDTVANLMPPRFIDKLKSIVSN